MKPIGEVLVEKKPAKDAPPHPHAAAVNAIMGFMKRYPKEKQMRRGYWDKFCKGVRYGDVMVILKDAGGLDPKYSKGGFITNRLKALSTGRPRLDK